MASLSSLFLLASLAAAVRAAPNLAAQSITSCPADAGNPAVASMTSSFPPIFSVAQIVQGDTVASSLWASIQANKTIADALAIAPVTLSNGLPVANAQTPDTCNWSLQHCTTPKRAYLPADYSTCPQGKTWGVTVDDGPSPNHCALYKLFADNNIAATLFYIGSNVIANPGAAAQGYGAGHAVCVHTWSHRYTTSLTNEQVFAELYYTALAIKRVVGVTPTCWRPPYGDVDDRVRAIASGLGLSTWLWDNNAADFSISSGTPASTVIAAYGSIASGASASHGTVVLQHEISLPVTQAFISSFATISNAFTNVLAAHVCNNVQPYAEPNAPTLPSFDSYLTGARMTGNLTAVTDPKATLVLARNAAAVSSTSVSSSAAPTTAMQTSSTTNVVVVTRSASIASASTPSASPSPLAGAAATSAAVGSLLALSFTALLATLLV